MLKAILFIAGAALALPASAQVTSLQSANPAPSAKSSDPNKKICEKVERLGSRLAADRVCMTAAEWDALRRGHRHDLEKVQQVVNQNPSN